MNGKLSMMDLPARGERARRRRGRLRALALVALILLVPALLVWIVNLEVAVRVFAPGIRVLAHVLPPGLFRVLEKLAADLSTVSTLAPVLLLWFPFVQAHRILRRRGDEAYVHGLDALPYPAHFPYFLVMLGLAGTLYGLLLGLSVSGLSGMVEGAPSAEDLPAVLERLMDGTATALLSSLVGLIGAFLAARPMVRCFEWAAMIEAGEEEWSLEDTLGRLTSDLKALGAVTRALADEFGVSGMQAVLSRLERIDASQAAGAAAMGLGVERLDGLLEAQRAMAQALGDVGRLVPAVVELSQGVTQLSGALTEMRTAQDKLLAATGDVAVETRGAREAVDRLATGVQTHVAQFERDATEGRERMRRAFRVMAEVDDSASP